MGQLQIQIEKAVRFFQFGSDWRKIKWSETKLELEDGADQSWNFFNLAQKGVFKYKFKRFSVFTPAVADHFLAKATPKYDSNI